MGVLRQLSVLIEACKTATGRRSVDADRRAGCSEGSDAVGAETGDHEVDVLGAEVVVVTEMGSDLVDQFALVMVHLTTLPANHVEMVVGVGDLPSGRIVDPEVGFPDQVETIEKGEGAVDGGDVDGGVGLVDPGGDVVGGQVAIGRAQDGPHQPARAGESVTVPTEDAGEVG